MGGRVRIGAGTVSRGRVSRLAAAGIGPLASVGFWVSVGVSACVGIFGTVAPVRAEAPITSPQDAACRNEARAKVFVTPDPHGIGLYAVGRQIYMACMARAKPRVASRRRR